MKKMLVLSSSIGAGHTMAAQALCEEALRSFPGRLELVHHDLMQMVGPHARLVYSRAYLALVDRNPHLWGYLYDRHNRERAVRRHRRLAQWIAGSGRRKLFRLLRELRPERILATHFLAADLLLERPGRVPPVEVVVTDFEAHAMWVHPRVARYHVACEGTAAMLRAAGVPACRIAISGIPLRPAFVAPHPTRAVLFDRLGLDPRLPAVLVSCGGSGMSSTVATVQRLLQLDRPVQLLAVAGKNLRLQRTLQALRPRGPVGLRVFGHVGAMHELMQAADLMVAKCGGLTASEALAVGLPLVITRPIPGQETANSDYLLEAGAALRADDPALLLHKVGLLLDDPARRRRMREAALRVARPDAAQKILAPHAAGGTARIVRGRLRRLRRRA